MLYLDSEWVLNPYGSAMSRMKQATRREMLPVAIAFMLQLAASIIREALASDPTAIGIAIALQVAALAILAFVLVKWAVSAVRKRRAANE